MSGKSINFDDKKINKSTFYKNKKLFNIHDLDVNKILVSKKDSYGTKIHLDVIRLASSNYKASSNFGSISQCLLRLVTTNC